MDANKLWQNFLDTVTNHYFDTQGRVGRAQFWYFVLVEVIVGIGVGIVSSIVFPVLLPALFGLAMTLPNLGMSVRRMQDTGAAGTLAWACFGLGALWQVMQVLMWITGPMSAIAFLAFSFTFGWLISLAYLVLAIAVIYFCAQPGQTEANPFGPVPPAFAPN
ncbi:MAG: DUF805 domain-containing protein [Proteobacteria bacterium]|nr:DUF805 domain-containing protein [Pseudomonadota bacterium]